MTKANFQSSVVEEKYSDLFFHSGGSSGEPKLSIFTYDDYHRQMEVAADGLYAAGLDPKTDRTMNLFYAGNLYGGFTSFFTILEMMEAVQFPMGASTDFKLVAETIVKNKVDTILGMPSYIMQLFREQSVLLKNGSTVKKIFFGGEHMSLSQQNYLKKEFGVEVIRSATYGSVDAGPLGYQCSHATSTIHHLHERLHNMEVVDLENDQPVNIGEVGRLLFSSKVRHGQNISRYEIGDVGRIVEGVCQCGRSGTRFELLGRHGDVFRIGTMFLSYQKFQKILMDLFEFEGVFQIKLIGGSEQVKEKIEIIIEDVISNKNSEDLVKLFIQNYEALQEAVVKDQVLNVEVQVKSRKDLVFNEKTGKLKTVIDMRMMK
jgi:phenylacetate-coenzyme A ligase PaaK-like adenylate-forming protein